MESPYTNMPGPAFWRRAVAGPDGLIGLFASPPALATAKIATAGSCFAQHIGRALRARGLNYLDLEPAPAFLTRDEAARFGYGLYSCRYGNIYTARQLLQLLQEAFGERPPNVICWERHGRFYDALRPGIEPDGFGSPDEVRAMRMSHLRQVRQLFAELEVFVFTLGLTEAWLDSADGTVFPIAPGVIAGSWEPSRHIFHNFRYGEVYDDLSGFIAGLRAVNPRAEIILTVSPVPLAATASGNHVLESNAYSKAALRAAAGDITQDIPGVRYFPSFEIVSGHQSRGAYYNADLRTVTEAGVAAVMRHFLGALDLPAPAPPGRPASVETELDAYAQCEEALLDREPDL